MLADLNVPWPANPTPLALARLSRTLLVMSDLGYTVIALNNIIEPKHLPSTKSKSKINNNLHNNTITENPINLSLLPYPPPPSLTILTRATLILDDSAVSSAFAQKLPALSLDYDILAVRPTTERSILLACTSYDSVNLISFDLSTRLPCFLRHKTIGAAIARGIVFEIIYSGGSDPSIDPTTSSGTTIKLTSITNNSDPNSQTVTDEAGAALSAVCNPDTRKNQLSGASSILRAVRGKRAVVVSSEAWSPLAVRGPYDVVNLATTWGLDHMRARDSIGRTASLVIKTAQLRRNSYKQVIMLSKKRKTVQVGDDAHIALPKNGHLSEPPQPINYDGMDMSDDERPGLKRRKFV